MILNDAWHTSAKPLRRSNIVKKCNVHFVIYAKKCMFAVQFSDEKCDFEIK